MDAGDACADMTEKWYNSYGWDKNPFEIKPHPLILGADVQRDKLVNFIQSGGIALLTGKTGTGKSSLLRTLKDHINDRTLVYVDAKGLDREADLRKYVRKAGPFFRRLLGKYPKNAVLIIDEAQLCSDTMINDMESLWDNDKIKSIVLAQTEVDLQNYPNSFRDRLGQRIVRLGSLVENDSKKLIKLRAGENTPFEEDTLTFIAQKSGHIPRTILENCEILCIELGGKKPITRKDAEDTFVRMKDQEIREQLIRLEDKQTKVITPVDRINYSDQFSPMQKTIINVLMEKNRTTDQIASILNSSNGSVGKQLHELKKLDVVEIVNPRRPKVFALKKDFVNQVFAKIDNKTAPLKPYTNGAAE